MRDLPSRLGETAADDPGRCRDDRGSGSNGGKTASNNSSRAEADREGSAARRRPVAKRPAARCRRGTAAAGGPGAPPRPAEPPKPTETVDEVLNKYVQAIGGREALQKIQSRVMTGTVTLRDLQQVPVTVEEKLPGSYRLEIQSQPQPQSWGASGTAVWGGRGGGRGMQGFQAQQARRRADLGAPLSMAQRYQNLTANRYETIEDRNTIVLVGRT